MMRNIVVWCAILLAVEVNGLYDGDVLKVGELCEVTIAGEAFPYREPPVDFLTEVSRIIDVSGCATLNIKLGVILVVSVNFKEYSKIAFQIIGLLSPPNTVPNTKPDKVSGEVEVRAVPFFNVGPNFNFGIRRPVGASLRELHRTSNKPWDFRSLAILGKALARFFLKLNGSAKENHFAGDIGDIHYVQYGQDRSLAIKSYSLFTHLESINVEHCIESILIALLELSMSPAGYAHFSSGVCFNEKKIDMQKLQKKLADPANAGLNVPKELKELFSNHGTQQKQDINAFSDSINRKLHCSLKSDDYDKFWCRIIFAVAKNEVNKF